MLDGILESSQLYFLGKPVWYSLYRRQSLEVEAKRNIPCEFEVLTVVLLNMQFLWEVNPYRFLEASLTVYRLTWPKIPQTQHSGKFQSSVYKVVQI